MDGVIMEDLFEKVEKDIKKRVVVSWKEMSETEKVHFINQVSLALSVWGADKNGKKIVVEILKTLVEDGSTNLSDFGLYVDHLIGVYPLVDDRRSKVKRASLILEGYRMKNGLPSVPHKELGS